MRSNRERRPSKFYGMSEGLPTKRTVAARPHVKPVVVEEPTRQVEESVPNDSKEGDNDDTSSEKVEPEPEPVSRSNCWMKLRSLLKFF